MVRTAEYKLAVNGEVVATAPVFATNLGSVRFFFSTTENPPPVLPVTSIRRIELRDAANRVVLSGEFREDLPTDLARRAYKQARLIATAATTDQIGGSAVAKIEGPREELSVRAEGLIPGATYTVVIDGLSLGSIGATASGFLGVLLASDGSAPPLPPALRPVTKLTRIEVLDGRGVAVLRGEFRAVNVSGRPL
jgi:hypothetical protein